MTDRIPLDDLTSDQLDALYDRLEQAEQSPAALPAPASPAGELFHYTPDQAAYYLPFTARKLREMAYRREVDHVNNGNRVWFSGRNIRAISEQFTRPATEER
jgi:hypothetical protein